jgi:hypothetical protein
MTDFLDRLDALAAKATPGPFHCGPTGEYVWAGAAETFVANCINDESTMAQNMANAAYITAFLNAAPALTRALRAAKDRRKYVTAQEVFVWTEFDSALADLEKLK